MKKLLLSLLACPLVALGYGNGPYPAGGGSGVDATNISGGTFNNVTFTGSSTIPNATTAGSLAPVFSTVTNTALIYDTIHLTSSGFFPTNFNGNWTWNPITLTGTNQNSVATIGWNYDDGALALSNNTTVGPYWEDSANGDDPVGVILWQSQVDNPGDTAGLFYYGVSSYIASVHTNNSCLSNNMVLSGATFGGNLYFTNQMMRFDPGTNVFYINLGAEIASLYLDTNAAAFGGGKLQLNAGTYFTGTNAFFTDVSSPFMPEICGAGAGRTVIVFTNWNGTCPAWTLGSLRANPLSVYIHDLRICTTNDCTNSILKIYNTAVDHLERLVFTPWPATLSDPGEPIAGTHLFVNAIGLEIDSTSGEGTSLKDLYFGGMHIGAIIGADHPRIEGYIGFEDCGGADWPSCISAAWGTNLYSVGACMYINSAFNDAVVFGTHSARSQNGIIRNSATVANILFIGGDSQETGGFRFLTTDAYTNASSGPLISMYKSKFNDVNATPNDGTLYFTGTRWTNRPTAPPNLLSVDVRRNSFVWSIGGHEVLTLSSTNITGNGGGLTNVPTGFLYMQTNTAPSNVTLGVTAPDGWVTNFVGGNLVSIPYWKNH